MGHLQLGLRVTEDLCSVVFLNFNSVKLFGLTQTSILHTLILLHFAHLLHELGIVVILGICEVIRASLSEQNLITLELALADSHFIESSTVASHWNLIDFDWHVRLTSDVCHLWVLAQLIEVSAFAMTSPM